MRQYTVFVRSCVDASPEGDKTLRFTQCHYLGDDARCAHPKRTRPRVEAGILRVPNLCPLKKARAK